MKFLNAGTVDGNWTITGTLTASGDVVVGGNLALGTNTASNFDGIVYNDSTNTFIFLADVAPTTATGNANLNAGSITTSGDATINGDITANGSFVAPAMRSKQLTAGSGESTTSLTPVPMASHPGLTFVAPTSGTVKITLNLFMRSSLDTKYAAGGYQVRVGGTIGSGSTFGSFFQTNSTTLQNWIKVSNSGLVTGLAAGVTYNVQIQYYCNDAAYAAWISQSTMLIEPQW
jgi:hypothetical protein